MYNEITSISELPADKSFLAWVSYPYNNTNPFCFAYPQWIYANGSFTHIAPTTFLDRGAIFISIQGGDNAGSIQARYGEIVVATINASTITNRNYNGQDVEDRNFAMLNEHYRNSEIEFSRVTDHSFGRNLIQIVTLEDDDLSLEKPLDAPVSLLLDLPTLATQWVMIERKEGTQYVYYGPLSAQQTLSGEYELDALTQYRRCIFKLNASEIGKPLSLMRMHDATGVAARFIDRSVLTYLQKYPGSNRTIDWVTDEELVDAIADVVKNAHIGRLDPDDMRRAIKAIETCSMSSSGLYLSDQRKSRMEALLQVPELWENKIDILAEALTRPAAREKLLELGLSETYFPRVRDVFIKSEAIQQQVEQERQKYYAETEKAKLARAEALQAKSEADHQLEEGKARIQAMREEALSSVQGELQTLQQRCEATRTELEVAQRDLCNLDSQAEGVIKHFDKKAEKIIEGLLTHRILSSVREARSAPISSSHSAPLLLDAPIPVVREDEAQMTPQQVISALYDHIVVRAGRPLASDQVVNMITCLMGSSMTVFSGLPGTGKTSLAGVLAGALGLLHHDCTRFIKISVERGWTSHRDYIGYYNPLSGRMEASNTEVFKEVVALDAEYNAAKTHVGTTDHSVPYLMLLDEANLSVVENYWSPFLSNADRFLMHPLELSMQGGTSLHLPVNVRWVATVNYDHTTEALSDRFLNRVWVINIEADAPSVDDLLNSSDIHDFSTVAPFSYGKLMSIFGPLVATTIEDVAAKRLMASLFSTCSAQGTPVSHRCQRAIVRYVATVEPLLRELQSQAGVRAVDFAVAQRVLPSIKGTGDETRNLLQELRSLSPLLSTTNARIDYMLQAGDADGFYQFFV